ncbi:MAG: hypothetical protein E7258_06575 [Lachnospiraceae bacterium]|nr:hypothetical protein [Lachnospiraceae bacterium]
MGSGLSLASVNKIKELAEQREYGLALDIVDSQDLSKSLNPQFLRVCGDIYIYNNRYVDARKVLIMAHRLAPEGKRVMYSLTDLYLRMGYEDLAKQYYEIYLFDAEESSDETKQIKYIYAKAHGEDMEKLEGYLCPHYIHNLDYDWSFEAFLILSLRGNTEEADILALDYCATYKNSEYSTIIDSIKSGSDSAEKYFNVYLTKMVSDDDPEQADIREEEARLLEADWLRIHPKEAQITIEVDDYEEVEIGTIRKYKKFLKSQDKQKTEQGLETSEEQAEVASTGEASETQQSETNGSEDVLENSELDMEKKGVKDILKKVFSKKKKDEDSAEEIQEDESSMEEQFVDEENDPEGNKPYEMTQDESDDNVLDETEDSDKDSLDSEDKVETEISVESDVETEFVTEEQEFISDDDFGGEELVDEEEEDMREIYNIKHNPIVSVDLEENDFAAESDTIEGLHDEEFSNPFDGISAFDKEKEESGFSSKKKTEFMFDDIDMSDDDEFGEVDDFTQSDDDDEFGEMKSHLDEIFGTSDKEEEKELSIHFEDENPKMEEEFESDIEEAFEEEEEIYEGEVEETFDKEEEIYEEEVEETFEVEEEIYEEEVEETFEVEEEIYEEEVEETYDKEEEIYEEEVEETYDKEEEIYEEEVEETYDKEEEIYEEEVEETYEEEEEIYEEEVEETYEEEEEIYEEEVEETFEEEEEIYEEEVEETFEEEEEIYEEEESYEEEVAEVQEVPHVEENHKKSIDFPVFKSSLFPNYNKKVTEVENNFNQIMTEAQDKIQDNLRKEEQMQKEAEALLASLGIDLSSISVTSSSIESINETLYNEPSRDELKASLKIDSVKKNILRQLKEYR